MSLIIIDAGVSGDMAVNHHLGVSVQAQERSLLLVDDFGQRVVNGVDTDNVDSGVVPQVHQLFPMTDVGSLPFASP
jgi:hypothetical protein